MRGDREERRGDVEKWMKRDEEERRRRGEETKRRHKKGEET